MKLFAAILTLSVAAVAQTTPTYSKDVAPLIYKNCASCHRAGEIAPMSLLTYDQVRPWAKSIKDNVSRGVMPPWQSDDPHGTFSNDRRLTDAEKSVIERWVDAGAPQGDPKDMPAMPKFTEGWEIGKPDAIIAMPKPFAVPATGTIPYQYVMAPTNFTEDKWVQAIEVRPGTRSVVHHILVYERDPVGMKHTREAFIPVVPEMPKPNQVAGSPESDGRSPGTLIAMTAPGTNAMVFAPGTALKIAAGSTLLFQIHYTANGKTPETDVSSVGLIFAKEPPRQEVHISAFLNPMFTLPAGAPDTAVPSAIKFTEDAHIMAIIPHTHLRGKSWQYREVYPDGHAEAVLSVPHYDFNWQTFYKFAKPLAMPKGARLEAVAHYDNSPENKSNPDPTKNVHWGDQTWQEMQYTGIVYTIDGSHPAAAPQNASGGGQ